MKTGYLNILSEPLESGFNSKNQPNCGKTGYLNILSEPLDSKNQPNCGPIQLVKQLTLFFKNREKGAVEFRT